MSKGDKYLGLKNYLKISGESKVILTFSQIETIINDVLPNSAYEYSSVWWSNDPNHSQAIAWLDAGYRTEQVSISSGSNQIIFVKRV